MLRYKAGYKYVDGGVHAQVLDFPAAITAVTWRRPDGCWELPLSTWPRRLWSRVCLYQSRTRKSSMRKWISKSRSICTYVPARGYERFRPGPCCEAAGSHPAPTGTRVSSPPRGSRSFGLGQPGERPAECRASSSRDWRIHWAGDLPPTRHPGAVTVTETTPNHCVAADLARRVGL